MAEWDVSKIAKALNDYNSKTVGNGEQKEIKVTTEDIRKAIKELGKKEENPNEKTFVDFDDGAVAMPSDADLQKIMEKLEKKEKAKQTMHRPPNPGKYKPINKIF